jgi:cyclase
VGTTMNLLRIIPSLLLSNKKLVKGTMFKNHKSAGNPITTTLAFENQGADEISIIDIDCYKKKDLEPDYNTLSKIAKFSTTPITFGGGVKNLNIAKKVIRAGAEKIYINRSILKNKGIITDLVKYFGGQAVVVGINLFKENNNYRIYEDIKNEIDLEKYILQIQEMGIGEIKILFVDREGNKIGLDLECCKYLNKIINVSCIFEGGIGSLDHLENAFDEGIKAISLGTMLIFCDYNIVKIKTHLLNKGYNVRL